MKEQELYVRRIFESFLYVDHEWKCEFTTYPVSIHVLRHLMPTIHNRMITH